MPYYNSTSVESTALEERRHGFWISALVSLNELIAVQSSCQSSTVFLKLLLAYMKDS